MEKGHPHMHFMSFDNEQEIQKGVLPENRINNIRKELNKYIFKEEFSLLYEKENFNKKGFQESTKKIFEDIENIYKMSNKEYKKYIKEKINKLSLKIIKENTELNANFEKYLDSVKDIAKMGVGIDTYTKKSIEDAERELLKYSGNQILKVCKDIKKEEHEKKKEKYEKDKKAFEMEYTINLITNIGNYIGYRENMNSNKKSILNKREKAQSLKLAQKLANKSNIDWGQEL